MLGLILSWFAGAVGAGSVGVGVLILCLFRFAVNVVVLRFCLCLVRVGWGWLLVRLQRLFLVWLVLKIVGLKVSVLLGLFLLSPMRFLTG